MPRQRMIWPDLWEDEDFGRLTPSERLLFIALFSNADDEGRLVASPANLRALAFRYEDLTLDQVRTMRDHVVQTMDHVTLYEVQGSEYIQLDSWSKRQHPKYPQPSRLPAPLPQSQGPSILSSITSSSSTSSGLVQPSSITSDGLEESFSEVHGGLEEDHAKTGGGFGEGLGYGLDQDSLGKDRRNNVQSSGPTGPSGPGSPSSSNPEPRVPKAHTYSAEFEAWWAAYPRKEQKWQAAQRYQARRREGYSADALRQAIDVMVAAKRDHTYLQLPKTFLGPDVAEWIPGTPAAAERAPTPSPTPAPSRRVGPLPVIVQCACGGEFAAPEPGGAPWICPDCKTTVNPATWSSWRRVDGNSPPSSDAAPQQAAR